MAGEHGGSGGAIRELLAVFGFGVDTSELKKGESELGKFFDHVKQLGESLIAVFAVEKVAEFAEAHVRAMTEIERSATRLGVSTDEVQAYQFAAQSLGLESETLINLMGRLQVAQQAAAQGSKQASTAFSQMGVSLRDENGHMKEADQLFIDVAEGISKEKDASKQAALATQVFGRSGRELLPILKKGAAGINELIETYHQLGGGYSEKAIAASKEFEEQSAKQNLVTKALKGTILEALLPILTKLSKATVVVVTWFREMIKESNAVQATLLVLGSIASVFALKMALAFAPVLLIAAAIGALILVVDDLMVLLEGGDSEIGDLIDKIFGKDARLDTIQAVRSTWHDIKDYIHDAARGIKEYVEWYDEMTQKAIAYVQMWRGLQAGAATGNKAALLEYGTGMATLLGYEKKHAPAISTGKAHQPFGPAWPPTPEEITSQPGFRAPFDLGAPRVGGTPPASPTVLQQTTVHMDIHPAPGMNEKMLGEHIAKAVSEVNKQERRAAAATFQRSGSGD